MMPNAIKTVFNFLSKHRTTIFFWSFFLILLFGINIGSSFVYNKYFNSNLAEATDSTSEDYGSECTALGINLHGEIVTYVPLGNDDDTFSNKDIVASESVVSLIQEGEDDDNIKAIILEVDSPGGSPVAGEEIAKALKESTKPTVAVIRQSGLSAAYWASTGADYIFASKNSDVGSIGVTASYVEDLSKDKKFIQLSTGKYKDSGNPDKPITDEEKSLFMRDINIIHQNFIQAVAKNRLLSVEDVTKVADGSSVLGDKAKELGLVDEIGGLGEATQYLEDKTGTKLDVCW